jgi:hypothetical protein
MSFTGSVRVHISASADSRPLAIRVISLRGAGQIRCKPAAWISDTLCRLGTGGGFAVRQLYSDQDEVLFDAARPVVLNGIEDTVTRPDLADRAVFLTLEPIPEDRLTNVWRAGNEYEFSLCHGR